MKNKKRLFMLLTILIVGLCCALNSFAAGRGVSDDTIKMGLIMARTGPIAVLGISCGSGVLDNYKDTNDQGGIHGRKVEVIWEDDQFKTPQCIAKFKKLIFRDKVLSIVNAGTPQTIALFDLIEKYQSVDIPMGLAEEMYEPIKPYIFSLGATYETQIQLMFDYIMNDLKAKDPRIAIVYCETEFGKKGLYAARKRAEDYGMNLVTELVLPIGVVDASSQVLALKKGNVDYVLSCNNVPEIIVFLKTAEKFDYWPMTFGVNFSSDNIVVKSCKTAAKNYIGVNFVGGWFDDTPGMKKVRGLAEKNNRDPNKMLTSVYTIGVGLSSVLIEGLTRAGKNLTPESFKDALESLREFDTEGIVPPVTYTSTSHAPANQAKLFRADVQQGVLVSLTGWRKPKVLQ